MIRCFVLFLANIGNITSVQCNIHFPSDDFSSDEKEGITKLSVVEKLLDILQNAKDNKVMKCYTAAL